MTMRVLIADDEAPARKRLRRLLSAIPEVGVIDEAASGEEAVALIERAAFDLVLLDVQMPVLDGFEVVAAVGVDRMPPTIFVTAYDAYALRAFDVRALDYLVKPVAADRLTEAVSRVRLRNLIGVDEEARRRTELDALVASQPLRRIFVRTERGAKFVPVESILLARAQRNYVTLHTTGGDFRLRTTIASLATRLDSNSFLRANRSDLVHLDAIRELQPWSHGEYRIVLKNDQVVMWSRRFRAAGSKEFELRLGQ